MPLSEAKAILSAEGVFVQWEEDQTKEAQKKWLDIVAEFSDLVEPDQPHSAYLDLSDHARALEVATSLAQTLESRLGYIVRIGLAGARWVAERVARVGIGNALVTPRRIVAPLPTEALPIPLEDARRLRLLGYATVGQVAGIGLETLRSQFGEGAFEIARAALGGGKSSIDGAYPPNALAERFSFDSSPDSVEVLANGFEAIASKLARALSKIDGTAEVVELFLEQEDGSISSRSRKFTKPIRSRNDITNAVRLLLPNPPEVPLTAVRVRLPNVQNSKRVQLGLNGERSRSDMEHGTAVAVGHVKSVFGEGAIQLASQIKEPRWKLVRRAYSAVNGWTWA
jgi:protein ImuB